jgi:hypothetical protein
MAEIGSQPRKAGEYERPARASGMTGIVIGALVLIALIILAIVLFGGRGEQTSGLYREGTHYAAIERGSGTGQGGLMWNHSANLAAYTQ